MLENYLSSEWPNKTACEINRWKYVVPSFANLPQLFMNPENKGYSVSDLLTKYLGLAPSQEHPLPWDTPQCGSFVRDEQPTPVTSIFKLPAVLHAESLIPSPKLMEDKLKPVFLHLVDGHSTEADIAQRIKTLIDYGIGPRWLCFNIAALYWRIKGSPNEAITCLRAALYFEPERHADIALTQLASIILRTAKVEHLSDVVAVLSAAMRVNPNEVRSFQLEIQ
ncbi:hypothetical protein AB6A40_011288 [Gnathostoma spinigerum]|uniref:Uncharacterized protein n=1 Tax=Gnathostoma spinigerum TaxID=75299 RepID=A0ABD6F1H2_9BILA